MDDDFTTLEQESWGSLLEMHGWLMRRIDSDLQEHQRLSHIEFETLLRLSWAKDGRLRIQDLAARSVFTRSGISRVVERLGRLGVVTREGQARTVGAPMLCSHRRDVADFRTHYAHM
jgi:DNA-binding MarR family transcriptional regulator